jgi:phytoene dehydrogenase-like protein
MEAKSVIIIGSGLGGLIAGNLLAKKGHNVTIFESHSSPGGYTAGFYKNGFYFESGTLSFEASASIFKAMKDIGVLDKISFTRYHTRWIGKYFDSIPNSYSDFKKMLYDAFSSESDRLDKYFAQVDKMYRASAATMNKTFPFLYSGLGFFLSMLSYIAGAGASMKIMKQYADMTSSEFNGRFFEKGSKLYKLLNRLMYPDMAAWMVGSALSMFDDYWTVSKGMQSWADILADNFKSIGGRLKLNSRVDRILTEDGAAVGISCGLTEYKADYVISASDYKKTFLNLLDNKSLIPQQMQSKIANAAVSEAVFTVYLGLNMPNEKLKSYMKIPHAVYCDLDSDADFNNAGDENYFSKSSVMLYSPSMHDQQLAPAGKSSLMLMAGSPSGWMNNWGGGDRNKYKELKEKAKNALINKACSLIPDLPACIEYQDAATPLTYERFTGNTNGATSAWSWNPKKKFFPRMMDMGVDTPVKNLYIGSCWANQMGGVPGALIAAYICAKKIK